MIPKSIKRALAAATLVASSTLIGVGAATHPAHAYGGIYVCDRYRVIADAQLNNYDVTAIISTWVVGGVRYDYIEYSVGCAG